MEAKIEKPKRGRPQKYTPERVQIIVNARRNGETYELAAKRAGVAESLIYAWKERYLDFRDQIKKAESEHEKEYVNELLTSAKRSLGDLVRGYEYEEVKTEYENDAKGNPRIKKQTNTTKRVPPNPTAIIFTLTNLEPETWKNRQTTDLNGKVETDGKTDISLANVPDDLLAKVIDAINGK